jgi:homoprotocatechuate degradation regulator HpaR
VLFSPGAISIQIGFDKILSIQFASLSRSLRDLETHFRKGHMSKKNEYRNLPNLLLKAREVVLSQFRPIIAHFGLTEQQWRILRTLSEMGQINQRELSEVCQILGPSLTGVLSRMDDMGLVSRERLQDDQRRVAVCLSARGEKLVAALSPLIFQQYRNLEKAFGRELITEVYAVMDKFLGADPGPLQLVELPDIQELDRDIAILVK